VLALLAPHPAPRLAYLRHLVEEEGSEVEAHHTQLALALLAQPEGGGGRAALSRLVLTSAHLNTEFLLHRLQGSDLTYERAVLMGRAGNHQAALELLVQAHLYEEAEQYCEDMAGGREGREGRKEERGRLLVLLLATLLSSEQEEEEATVRAVELVNSRAEEMPATKVLSLLPASWSLSVVEAGLRRLGRAAVHRRRMAGVTRHLSRGRTVALQTELAAATRAPLVLLPSSYCVVCSKPFTQGGVARYPNGVALHAACVRDERVCPLTGQVFTVAK